MLDVEKVKKVINDLKQAEAHAVKLKAEMDVVKKQATEIFKKHRIKGFAEMNVLEDKLKQAEQDVAVSTQQAVDYIAQVNQIKQETENVLIG